MSMLGLLLVLLTAAMTMGANLMMRGGIDSGGGFAPESALAVVLAFLRLLTQPLFLCGFVLYFLASLVWMRVIASEPLSVAYPVLVSLTFALVTGGAVFFFHEPLSLRKVVGLVVILVGILVISMEKGAA
ncbi:MAG: SMR family transporter [Tepidisphaeraceae bacterium]